MGFRRNALSELGNKLGRVSSRLCPELSINNKLNGELYRSKHHFRMNYYCTSRSPIDKQFNSYFQYLQDETQKPYRSANVGVAWRLLDEPVSNENHCEKLRPSKLSDGNSIFCTFNFDIGLAADKRLERLRRKWKLGKVSTRRKTETGSFRICRKERKQSNLKFLLNRRGPKKISLQTLKYQCDGALLINFIWKYTRSHSVQSTEGVFYCYLYHLLHSR